MLRRWRLLVFLLLVALFANGKTVQEWWASQVEAQPMGSPNCWAVPITTTGFLPSSTGQFVGDNAIGYSVTIQMVTGIVTATWEGALGTPGGAAGPFKILSTFSSFGPASGTDGNGQEMAVFNGGTLIYTRLNVTASGKSCVGGTNANAACTVQSQCGVGGVCTAAAGTVWLCAAPR